MGTELQRLVLFPLGRLERNRSIRSYPGIDDDLKYTSLKDIIPDVSFSNCIDFNESNGFNSTNISIRNQLVKQAASAYIQSTAILVSRNQNCLVRLWHKVKSPANLRFWQAYIQSPFRSLIRYINRPIRWLLDYMTDQIGRIVRSGTSPIA